MLLTKLIEWWVCRGLDLDPDPSRKVSDDDLASLENPKNGVITLSDEGVEVTHPKVVAGVRWEEIGEVFAYKRDLLTTDLICLGLCTENKSPMLEPHEEMLGYVRLWRELEKRLPGFDEKYCEWLLKSQPFDAQPTSVWKKET